MAEPTPIVLDASVGVKWIKPEAGREDALALLRAHRDGSVRIFVPDIFLHEVVAVAVRHGGAVLGRQAWLSLSALGLGRIGLDGRLAEAALQRSDELGCSFYDALAPAVAREVGAILYSADARAHAKIDGVRLI